MIDCTRCENADPTSCACLRAWLEVDPHAIAEQPAVCTCPPPPAPPPPPPADRASE